MSDGCKKLSGTGYRKRATEKSHKKNKELSSFNSHKNRLNNLALLCIESDILFSLDFKDLTLYKKDIYPSGLQFIQKRNDRFYSERQRVYSLKTCISSFVEAIEERSGYYSLPRAPSSVNPALNTLIMTFTGTMQRFCTRKVIREKENLWRCYI